jgi:hypothetical protein
VPKASEARCDGPVRIIEIAEHRYDPPRKYWRGTEFAEARAGLEVVTEGHDFHFDRNLNEGLFVGERAANDGRLEGECRVRWWFNDCTDGRCRGQEFKVGFRPGDVRPLGQSVP